MPLTVPLRGDQQLGDQRNVTPLISSGVRSRTLAAGAISAAFKAVVCSHAPSSCKSLLKRMNAGLTPRPRVHRDLFFSESLDYHLQGLCCF